MTVYTTKEYCEKFGMHPNTLRNRINKGNLPSTHIVKELDGRGVVIIIDGCEMCLAIEKACREYIKANGRSHNAEMAAALSIKYGINTAQLFRILAL